MRGGVEAVFNEMADPAEAIASGTSARIAWAVRAKNEQYPPPVLADVAAA
jgi:hypothetical protein